MLKVRFLHQQPKSLWCWSHPKNHDQVIAQHIFISNLPQISCFTSAFMTKMTPKHSVAMWRLHLGPVPRGQSFLLLVESAWTKLGSAAFLARNQAIFHLEFVAPEMLKCFINCTLGSHSKVSLLQLSTQGRWTKHRESHLFPVPAMNNACFKNAKKGHG